MGKVIVFSVNEQMSVYLGKLAGGFDKKLTVNLGDHVVYLERRALYLGK